MIHLVVTGRTLDASSRIVHEIEQPATLAELARTYRHPEWAPDQQLDHFAGSRLVDPSHVPADGDVVAIVPHVGEPVTTVLAIVALITTTASYIRAKRASDKAKRAQELRRERAYGFDTPSITAYGEGFRVPFGYGEYRTGGVVIGNRIEPSALVRLGSELGLQIALGQGPIESIGGLTMEPHGERNFLTRASYLFNGLPDPRFPFNTWEFPAGLRINGLDVDGSSVAVSLRKGKLYQSPMPDWSTAATSVSVAGSPLNVIGDATTYTTTESDVFRALAVIRFTEGLWFDGSSGIGRRRVFLRVEWRTVGGVWSVRNVTFEADPPMLNSFDYWVDFQVLPGGGPYELRVTRIAPMTGFEGYEANGNHGGRAHSTFTWVSTEVQYGTAFSYPSLALMSVRMPGSEQLNGQINNVSVPIRARKVRGYVNAAVGWTAETWGAVAPWTHPLSNNPAFAALDMLLSREYGLGHLVRERDVDLDAFRDWADYCDQAHPLDGAQPLLRFDGQFDSGADAIEALAALFAAGRAVPVISGGNRIGVKFQYRDAFSRGSGPTLNSVPTRVPVGIISTSSCKDFSITYSDPATAPVVIEWQFLDRSADYEMRTIALEDAAKTGLVLNDRPSDRSPRRESQQVLGVVRRLQVRYEIQLQHNRNRLARRTATVRMPIQALPYELGDLVLLQHDALSPSATTTQSFRTRTGGSVSAVVVDKPVSVTGATPRTTFGVWVIDTGGVERQMTADYLAPTEIAEGGTLNLWDPVGGGPASVLIQKGTEMICGPFTTTRQIYEIVAITTEENLSRKLDLEEWDPAMYDMPAGFDGTDGMGGLSAPQTVELVTPVVAEVVGTTIAGDGMRTTSTISWAPELTSVSRAARVYARTEDGRYSLLGETTADRLEGVHLHPGASYEISVCRQMANGVFPFPGQVTPTTISVPEFGVAAPRALVRLGAIADNHRVHLHWPAVDDALGYEVRRGEVWYGAEVLGVTEQTTFDVILPPAGTSRYVVKPRGRSGLYSDDAATVDVSWQPPNVLATATHLVANVAGGTAVDISWSGGAGAATITGSAMRGTWTAPALDLGKDVFAYWSAGARIWASDDAADYDDYVRGQPTRFYEVAGGRQATRLYPGADFDAGPASVPDDYSDPNIVREFLGEWVRVQVQTRYHVAGAWSAWAKHAPGWRMARQMEARLQFDRYATDIMPYAKTFVVTVGQ